MIASVATEASSVCIRSFSAAPETSCNIAPDPSHVCIRNLSQLQVVILCTELYLLAYRIGSKDYSVDSVVTTGLLTLQTAAVFVQVSLAAGAVEEVVSGVALKGGASLVRAIVSSK